DPLLHDADHLARRGPEGAQLALAIKLQPGRAVHDPGAQAAPGRDRTDLGRVPDGRPDRRGPVRPGGHVARPDAEEADFPPVNGPASADSRIDPGRRTHDSWWRSTSKTSAWNSPSAGTSGCR